MMSKTIIRRALGTDNIHHIKLCDDVYHVYIKPKAFIFHHQVESILKHFSYTLGLRDDMLVFYLKEKLMPR